VVRDDGLVGRPAVEHLVNRSSAALLQGRAEALPLAACLNEPPSPPDKCTSGDMDDLAAACRDSSNDDGSGSWRLAGYRSAEEAAHWRQVSLGLHNNSTVHAASSGVVCTPVACVPLRQHRQCQARGTHPAVQATPGLTGGTCVGDFEAANGRFRTRLRQVRITAAPASRNLSGWH
jgi:hypothetical protein